ncbi:MAG: hypothetical protein NTU59_07710 [Coprothermobacterota bacterium]|nr:hypothetical protein [Coprothermobacterota bacterium]
MPKKAITLLLIGFFAIGCVFAVGQAQAQTSPGTAEDPIITKSYLDQFLIPLVVELKKGQFLQAEAGTQIIVRVGETICMADPASAKGGLSDVTAGIDIPHLTAVATNHLLIAPRSDGRGLLAGTDAILLVWGLHQIFGP